MTRQDDYVKAMRESNHKQLDYIREKLHAFADSLTEGFTGEFEIRVPLLCGRMGDVSVKTTERQPKRN
jgi:hypothetical protein